MAFPIKRSCGGALTHLLNFAVCERSTTPAASETSVIVEIIIGLDHLSGVDDFAAAVWAEKFEVFTHDGFLSRVVLVAHNGS